MDRETQPSQTCIGTEKRLPEISLFNGFDPERTPFDELMCYQYDSSSALSLVSFLLFLCRIKHSATCCSPFKACYHGPAVGQNCWEATTSLDDVRCFVASNSPKPESVAELRSLEFRSI